MKLVVIALSTAAIIAFAPVVFAQGVSSKTPRPRDAKVREESWPSRFQLRSGPSDAGLQIENGLSGRLRLRT